MSIQTFTLENAIKAAEEFIAEAAELKQLRADNAGLPSLRQTPEGRQHATVLRRSTDLSVLLTDLRQSR